MTLNQHDTVTSRTESKECMVKMEFSARFLIISFGTSALMAFGIGLLSSRAISGYSPLAKESYENSFDTNFTKFPVPQLIEGKAKPDSTTINRYFDSSFPVSSLFLQAEEDEEDCNASEGSCSMDQEGTFSSKNEEIDRNQDDNGHDLEDDQEYLPAGQHLLIDVINVDEDFLRSEIRLANAMMQVVNQSKLTLLSYHCHSDVGVSCVGVLLESHIYIRTWPSQGVIILDLFTCGSGKLVPLMPLIEQLFVVPQTFDSGEKPFVNWHHKLRGFRSSEQKNYISKDIGNDFYGYSHLPEKKEIADITTDFQKFHVVEHFDIADRKYGSYLRSIEKSNSYESKYPELYQLERVVYLDGVMQSSRSGIEAYHEALVHPAMFAHEEPKRVAIIGGGEGATLREVLKHNTLEKVKMIEIDEIMVKMSRKYLSDWSDCSDLVGSRDWCVDDDRADMYYEDALGWFNDRFSENSKIKDEVHKEDPFDILIMDALDPEDDVPFADVLYTSESFYHTLFNSLSSDGIIVFQLGCSPSHDDIPQEVSPDFRRAHLVESLEGVGFKSIHLYEESHAGFGYPWSFLVAMKEKYNASLWGRSEAEVSVDIHERILRTHSGAPALKHFDGKTMEGYRIPSIVFQTAFCKKVPKPESCIGGIMKRRKDIPISSFEVKISDEAGGGRGVFVNVDLEKGSYVDVAEATRKIHFNPRTTERFYEILMAEPENAKNLTQVYQYADGYGWQTTGHGIDEYFVDSGILTFINHGCNGTYNVDDVGYSEMTEQNTDLSLFFSDDRNVYDPFLDRHYLQSKNAPSFTLRDIKKGEEILTNYLTFCEAKHEWLSEMAHYKQICNKQAKGDISQWEKSNKQH